MTEHSIRLRGILSRTVSDDRLFYRAVRGDSVAFSEVYRRYQPRIFAFCLSRLMDAPLAEEAAQETFVRLLHTDPLAIENPRSWLFGTARNVTLELMRQRSRSSATDDAELPGLSAPDSAEELVRREQGRSIVLALRRLRPRYRTALVMRELHGLSSAEMAEALETSVGAVDTLVSRARDAFGRTYAEVSDLPAACADTFPLIYKRLGSGLDDNEAARLEAHVSECARCRGEAGRASSPRSLGLVLPFVSTLGAEGPSLLGRLLASLDPLLATAPAATVATHAATRAVLAVSVSAALVVSAGTVSSDRPSPQTQRAVNSQAATVKQAAKPAIMTAAYPASVDARRRVVNASRSVNLPETHEERLVRLHANLKAKHAQIRKSGAAATPASAKQAAHGKRAAEKSKAAAVARKSAVKRVRAKVKVPAASTVRRNAAQRSAANRQPTAKKDHLSGPATKPSAKPKLKRPLKRADLR